LNEADAVIVPTNSLRPRLRRAGFRGQLHLSRHSIVPQELGLREEAIHVQSEALRFAYLGRLDPVKGVDLLIDAYRRLSSEYADLSLAIWGDASKQPAYLERLRRMGADAPGLTFECRYDPADLGRILAEVDVLVVPARWPEIGPFVVLEAFASGTPVIGARIGNIPELVEHGASGLLFAPDSVADLERQMRRVLEEPDLVQRLRQGIGPVRIVHQEMDEIMEVYSHIARQM
jgi:glycosyltransferase involved in cell wall biosynthesis